MKKNSLIVALLIINILAFGSEVKYVILFVGDGFGYNQRQMVEAYLGRKLIMSEMETSVRTNTNNSLGKTTDSAASGTAISCGVKTINRAIGVTPELRKLESIAQRLKSHGFKVGLVSSSPLNDATPAVFYAHQQSRGNTDSISEQINNLPVDYLSGAKLKGNHSLSVSKLKEQGYNVTSGNQALEGIKSGEKTYAVSQPFTIWSPGSEKSGYTLAEHAAKAIEMLDNPNGFFLLVENGHTDYSGHANDAGTLVREAVVLEDAVKVGLAFLAKHPDETLIVYTSDHETGGLNIEDMKADRLSILKLQTASIWDISKDLSNEDWDTQDAAIDFLQQKLGLQDQPFTADERQAIKSRAGDDIGNSLISAAFAARDKRCGIRYTSGGHTNSPIVTNASGVNAQAFAEALDNTDIPHIIKSTVLGDSGLNLNHGLSLGQLMERKYCKNPTKLMPVVDILNAKPYSYTWGKDAVECKFTIPYNTITAENYIYSDDIHAIKIVNNSGLSNLKFRIKPSSLPDGTWFFGWFGSKDFYVYDAFSFVSYGLMSELPNLEIAAKGSMLLLLSTEPLTAFKDAFSAKPLVPIALRESVDATNSSSTITIDGNLDEPAWSKAKFYDFLSATGTAPADAASGAIMIDPNHSQTIYIAAKLTDSEVVSNVPDRDGPLWNDDCIDLHLSGTPGNVIQFIINSDGRFYDAMNQNAQWNSERVQIATSRTENGWILEMAIPMSELKISGPLRGNIGRQHRPIHSMSGIFPIAGSLHDSAFWGTFILSEKREE